MMNIMDREALIRTLCAGYCSFYKPGKDEELCCRGFLLLEKLIEKGWSLPAGRNGVSLSMKAEDDLFQTICHQCQFFEEDCDFACSKRQGGAADVVSESVSPCGGFLCLGYCLGHGTVGVQDISAVLKQDYQH